MNASQCPRGHDLPTTLVKKESLYCPLSDATFTPPLAVHAYWTVICKTPNCLTLLITEYIGEDDGRPIYVLPSEMPGWFEYECENCHEVHRYTLDNFKATALENPPPAEYRPWF